MACLGVHFALTKDEVAELRALESDSDRLDYLQEEIEENYLENLPEYAAESDKAWDAIHRLLSDGNLSYTDGPEPLRWTVIGGEPLYFEGDYIMSLKTPDQVRAVSRAVTAIDQEKFRLLYNELDEEKYGFPKTDEDFEYTWGWFTGVVELFERAAADTRYLLFTADQ